MKAVTSIIVLFFLIGCGQVSYGQYETVESNTTNPTSEVSLDPVNEMPMEGSTMSMGRDYPSRFMNAHECNQIIDNEFIRICYDYELKVAKSVSYTLYGDLVNELNIQKRPSFYQEETLPEPYQAKSSDYAESEYDRGHLAPDAAFDWSQESLEATYTLANIIPQAPQVNRYMWEKAEEYARDKAVELGELQVINIVRYSDVHPVLGEGELSVSQGYYKILYNDNEAYEECFYYTNNLDVSISGDTVEGHRVDCNSVSY